MFRHKAFSNFLIFFMITALVASGIGFFISLQTGILILITSGLLLLITILFTRRRYADIGQLSAYLRQISNGDFSLDVRDNHEGELSILKSEIYKVTSMLSEHTQLLQKDKLHLTDAISDISHQLKTPLTSMTIMAELLSSDTLPPEKRTEFTRTIRIQLERIEWLVSALLKFSKLDAGTVRFKREELIVTDLIDQALEPNLIPIDVKDLVVRVEGDAKTTLDADMHWTVEALINIIKNAVSHTPDGGELMIRFLKNALFTEIIIEDNGPGIPKADLPYIFKRFYRGENATDDSVGIGLAMAYSIVTEQGGDIEVTSSADKGTTFKVKFYS